MQSGRATEKTDIYSFGVLMLEVLAGKRPTDASFIEKGLNIVGWVCLLAMLVKIVLSLFTLYLFSSGSFPVTNYHNSLFSEGI